MYFAPTMKEIAFRRSGMTDEETGVALGKILGADMIFTGSYLVYQKRIRINVRLIDIRNGRIHKASKITGNISALFEIQDKVVIKLLADVGDVRINDV